MLDLFRISPEFILDYRNEALTSFFKLFPYLATDYFYVVVFSVGHWLKPRAALFMQLGFLIPFSAIVCAILKDIFRIPRPDASLYLIPMDVTYGFPSADVLVGTVFWLSLCWHIKNKALRLLFLLPIVGVAMSRIYLGVHSVYDVTAGFLFAATLVALWNQSRLSKELPVFEKRTYRHFWYLISTVVTCYLLVANNPPLPAAVLASMGALLGFGLSLPWIGQGGMGPAVSGFRRTSMVIIGLAAILAITLFLPVFQTTFPVLALSVLFKYAFIVLAIYVLIPKLQLRMLQVFG